MMNTYLHDGMDGPGRRLRRIAANLALVAVAVIVAVVALEVAYRVQVVDFYRPELLGFNEPADLAEGSPAPTILCMGDSFTAGALSYPAFLRALTDSLRVINAGVSGTGVVQAAMIAPRRVARFEPDVLIYQIYVGNDLFDIRYPESRRAGEPESRRAGGTWAWYATLTGRSRTDYGS